MNTETLTKHFARMGARFEVTRAEAVKDYSLDIRKDGQGQVFVLRTPATLQGTLQAEVLQVKPGDRHLVLLIKKSEVKDRFLCGHDEREWFVAAVPGTASTVAAARQALKPEGIRLVESQSGMKASERNRRRNAVSIRQGEWFFVPMPQMKVRDWLILKNEPIRRGNGKPHVVAELYRMGGQLVYVCAEFPNGIDARSYKALLSRRPAARKWRWTEMRRTAGVFARGSVRHPDHATISLSCWHQVLMNTETESRTMANVAFLD